MKFRLAPIYLILITLTSITVQTQPLLKILEIDDSAYPDISAKFFTFDTDYTPVNNLNPSDFNINDNGNILPADELYCGQQNPVNEYSLVIAFDLAMKYSLSGNSNFTAAQDLSKEIVRNIDFDLSECALTSFDLISYLNKEFTSYEDELIDAIDFLQYKRGSFRDAGFVSMPAGAIPIAKNGTKSRAIIFITDGTGQVSADSVIAEANKYDISIYCLSFGESSQPELERISSETGGYLLNKLTVDDDFNEIANTILTFVKKYQLCELKWRGLVDCLDEHDVRIEIPKLSISSNITLDVPDNLKPFIESDPSFLSFSSVLAPATRDEQVKITAHNKNIRIDSITISDSHFTIEAGNVKDYLLLAGENHTLVVRFTPTDSAIVFGRLIIHSDACHGEEILITGGFPNTPPNIRTVNLLYPNCGETLVIGDTARVEWEGLLPKDVIQLEYSLDNGQTWDTLAKNSNGLFYDWDIPDNPSDSCLVRVIQLWPNNVGRTMDLRHGEGVNSAMFNIDYDYVVTACKDNKARIWNSNNGKLIHVLDHHDDEVLWANFSPDDRYVVTASKDTTAKVWDKSSGSLLHTLKGHTREVRSANFSPDSRHIITASADRKAIIWDVTNGEIVETLETSSQPLWFAEYHPSGDYILVAGNNRYVNMWEVSTKAVTKFDTENGFNDHASFDPSGNKIVVSSQLGGAKVFEVATRQKISSVEHLDTVNNSSPILFSDFDATGDTILTTAVDSKVKMWHAVSGTEILTFVEHTSAVKSAVMNFDGSRVLTSSWDSTAKIWNRNKRDLQMDTSDCVFRIARADAIAYDIDFGQVLLGDVVDTLLPDFITNLVDFPFNIRNIRIIGDAKDEFSILDGHAPYTLDSASTRLIELRFKPAVLGNRIADIEIILPDDTLVYRLNSEVIEAGLGVSDNYIDFQQVELTDFKDTTVSYIVRNKSSNDISISDISLVGPDFEHYDIISGGGPVRLSPQQGHEMTLRFTPEKLGRLNGQIQFTHDGLASPTRVYLFGEGVPLVIDSATISINDFSGSPGDIIDVPVYIKNISSRGIPAQAQGFFANLRYNSTLLEPLEPIDRGKLDEIFGSERIMSINLPLDTDGDGILTTLQFRVGLGNDTISPMIIENTAPLGRGKIVLFEESALFSLTGYCSEGGDRLYDSEGRLFLYQNRPNPVINTTTIEFSIMEKGYTELKIVDVFGVTVKTLVNGNLLPGPYSYIFDSYDIPSGMYYYILKTPTKTITRRMFVEK